MLILNAVLCLKCRAIFKKSLQVDCELTIAYYTASESYMMSTMQSLNQCVNYKKLDIISLHNLAYQKNEFAQGPNEILYNTRNTKVKWTPFISSNENGTCLSSSGIYGAYYSSLSGCGDAIFVNKLLYQNDEKFLKWYYDDKFIENRATNTCILYHSNSADQCSYITICPFIYNDQRASIFNYSVDYQESYTSDVAINHFIGFLYYIQRYIETNDVKYFVINGNANVYSIIWKQLINRILNNKDYYLSPTAAENFITNNSTNNCTTPEFVIVSKSFAPYGVEFDTTELIYDCSYSHYPIIARILSCQSIPTEKYKYELIYKSQIEPRKSQKNSNKLFEPYEYNVNAYNMSNTSSYFPFKGNKIFMPINEVYGMLFKNK